MELGLEGKVAVVTGAGGGIGRAVVDLLRAEGVRVAAGSLDVGALGGMEGVVGVAGDLATPEGPEALVAAAVDAFGQLDFLVNNVGAARIHFDGFAAATDEDWQWSFETNLMSTVRTVRASLPYVVAAKGGIVNVSSMNGKVPAIEAPEYSAMKAALINLTRSLAIELGPQGVRVNVVTPGPVRTGMQFGDDGFAAQLEEAGTMGRDEYAAAVEQAVPLGRWAEPEEIASAIVLLLSDRFSYATGADFPIDGAAQNG